MRTERTHEELQQAANEYLNAEGYESELDLLQEMLEYVECYAKGEQIMTRYIVEERPDGGWVVLRDGVVVLRNLLYSLS